MKTYIKVMSRTATVGREDDYIVCDDYLSIFLDKWLGIVVVKNNTTGRVEYHTRQKFSTAFILLC